MAVRQNLNHVMGIEKAGEKKVVDSFVERV
jgi:hypothetical protein